LAAEKYDLLGIAPGPDIGLPAVAALSGLGTGHTRKALTALEEASLLERRSQGRYAMHDLIRAPSSSTRASSGKDQRPAR
jgi:predicted transcriptional regulator of viral defense system